MSTLARPQDTGYVLNTPLIQLASSNPDGTFKALTVQCSNSSDADCTIAYAHAVLAMYNDNNALGNTTPPKAIQVSFVYDGSKVNCGILWVSSTGNLLGLETQP